MTYLFEAIKPTRLYHKQCSHCGLNYLGKSFRKDIEKYEGSGVYWQRHLKKHNAKAIHVWNSDWFYDKSIVEYALDLSKKLNIVESKDWANDKPENGLDGGWDHLPGIQAITAEKRRRSQSETKQSLEWKKEIEPQRVEKFQQWFEDEEWVRAKVSKELETKKSEEWKMKNYKTCPHCGKGPMDPSNFGKWHGKNCRSLL